MSSVALLAAEGVGAGDLVWATVQAIFFLLPLAFSAWAFLDVAHRPGWAWALAGRSRVFWMSLIGLGVLTLIGGLIISAWYLLKVRPVIAAAEEGKV